MVGSALVAALLCWRRLITGGGGGGGGLCWKDQQKIMPIFRFPAARTMKLVEMLMRRTNMARNSRCPAPDPDWTARPASASNFDAELLFKVPLMIKGDVATAVCHQTKRPERPTS